MKSLFFGCLFGALTTVGNSSAMASDLNFSYQGEFSSYADFLKNEVNVASQLLKKYLASNLGCSNIQVRLTDVNEPGIFSSGSFTLDLSASCRNEISDFDFSFSPPTSWEDYAELNIRYSNNYSSFNKNYKWNIGGKVYEDRDL